MSAADPVDVPQRASTPAIRLRDLSVHRQGRPVLEGIDLDVATGAVVGLTGHNGAGKTTLLRTVLGELPAAAGRVEVFGAAAGSGRGARRHRIAFAAQHPYPSTTPVTVRTAVAFGRYARVGVGRRLSRADWAVVDAMVERMALAGLARTPLAELSGGQQQRVNLARAFAGEPDLLLLDEPTTHLDGESIDVVLAAIGDFAGTVLLVTHGAGLRICDTVHRLGGGRLLA